MQVADFLQADLMPVARSMCKLLIRGNPDAPALWRRLEQESTHLQDAIVRHHPDIAGGATLPELLRKLLPCLHMHALRSRFELAAGDAPNSAAPHLRLNVVVT